MQIQNILFIFVYHIYFPVKCSLDYVCKEKKTNMQQSIFPNVFV